MPFLNENEIIRRLLDDLAERSAQSYGLNLQVKNLNVLKPEPDMNYKNYENGSSSSSTEASFILKGWKTYAENGLAGFLKSIIENDDDYAPVVDIEVYEIAGKGGITVNLKIFCVYTELSASSQPTGKSNDMLEDDGDKDEIIRRIEIRLSEIYSLVEKLRD